MHAGDVAVLVEVEVDEVLRLVRDVVLLHVLFHVEGTTQPLPSVGLGVLVELEVAVQDLVHGLLAADFDRVVRLRQLVDYPDFAGLLAQPSDAEALILPPWGREASRVPVGVGHEWWNVQVATHWAVVPRHIGHRIVRHFWLLRVEVQPVRDVGASGIDKGLGSLKMNILLNKLRQVVNVSEETDPAIVSCAVLAYLLGSVILPEFVRLGEVGGVFDS